MPTPPGPLPEARSEAAAGVSIGRALQNEGLRIHGKIFAFLKDDRLVVKLPAARVRTLIEAGDATSVCLSFHPGIEPAHASDLLVSFAAEGSGTRVRLRHIEWHRIAGVGPSARAAVSQGWDDVLDADRRRAGKGSADIQAEQVLDGLPAQHHPG